MALSYAMRGYLLAMGVLLAGCATSMTPGPEPLPENRLAAGECGLFVWTADVAKTFTLFAGPGKTTYFAEGKELSLTETNPGMPPATDREFRTATGKAFSLTLLSPQYIEGGTSYKAGRLTSLSDDGWEKVVPIVGLYACQPVI